MCIRDSRTDTRNIYAGAITLTQPLYMGGKIRAYNKITKYAEELAQEQHHGGMQEVIMSTDQVVKEIVQAHGENINVISTEGVGTEFIFTLPLSKKEG